MPNSLIRWEPFTELQNLRTAMDRQFDQLMGRANGQGSEQLQTNPLGLDVIESGDSFIVRAAIPGIDPKDVDITIEDDVLSISGEQRKEHEERGEQYVRRELHWGGFHRSLRLPPTLEVDKATANFENGMMELTLPKRPEARARSLKITPQGVIESAAVEQSGEERTT